MCTENQYWLNQVCRYAKLKLKGLESTVSQTNKQSNLSLFKLLVLRSYCSGVVWIPARFSVDASLRLMRLLRLSFSANIIDDFGILGVSSNSSLPWELTAQQFEADTNWSFFYWRKHISAAVETGWDAASKLCLSFTWGHSFNINWNFFFFFPFSKHFLDGYFMTLCV